jgi:hypothetical protein
VEKNGKQIPYPKHFSVSFAVFKITDQKRINREPYRLPYLHYACISERVHLVVKHFVPITRERYLSILMVLTSWTLKRSPVLLYMYVCMCIYMYISGPGSSVGIATGYGLDGPRIESRWGARFSAPVQTGPGAQPASCTMGIGTFPGVESGRSVALTPHPLLVPRSKNRVQLYLYSP